jgi:hypothetical protein
VGGDSSASLFSCREFQEQFGVLETVEKISDEDNACTRASKKTVQVLKKPGASPLLFGKFLMSSTAFLTLEDIADNLPDYAESVLSCEMDEALSSAYKKLEQDLRDAIEENRGNKSLMSTLLNTLLLYPDHPYGFEEIWARAFDPVRKEYVRFFVTRPEELTSQCCIKKKPLSSPTSSRSCGRAGVARSMRPTQARRTSTPDWRRCSFRRASG